MTNFRLKKYQNKISALEKENETLKSQLKQCSEKGLTHLVNETLKMKQEYETLISENLKLRSEYNHLLLSQKKLKRQYETNVTHLLDELSSQK